MGSWSTNAPTLPPGSSWGDEETASQQFAYISIQASVKTARGIGDNYYVRISAKFTKGGRGYNKTNVYFFVDDEEQSTVSPSTAGNTIDYYYTGQSASDRFTVDAGVSLSSSNHTPINSVITNVFVPARISYSITYSANGGTGSTYPQTAISGSTVTIRSNPFTRTGYTFVKWNASPEGNRVSYPVGSTVVLVDNMRLYAQWKKNNIPVYVNVGGTVYQVEKAYTNVNGTIKECKVYANVNGTIKTLE